MWKMCIRDRERVWRYDFTPNGIDLDSFPFNTWRKVSRNTLVDDNKEMFAGVSYTHLDVYKRQGGEYLPGSWS